MSDVCYKSDVVQHCA